MNKNKFSIVLRRLFFIGVLSLALFNCGSDNDEVEPMAVADTIAPEISCTADINEIVDVFSSGMVINYTEPVGTDNLPGATTTQTEGIASGETFPMGTTTNTFEVKDVAGNTAMCSFDVTVVRDAPSSDLPFFIEENPTPAGKVWGKVENLSDEFNDGSFDETKWQNTDPRRWIGRAPGIFKENTVSESDGNLKLLVYQLDTPEEVNGSTFTHAGTNIYSRNNAQVGSYIECRMKANKTFMSSTFWLINNRNAGTGCDKRITELDIQECVGEVTGTAPFAQSFDETIHSNTHSRQTECPETPTGSQGGNTDLGEKVHEDFHVYGCWWKSPTEIDVYLDGEKVYSITPKAEFSLPMALRLVTETYDWNPVPSDGGMTGTEEERTTYYDWVRTWELKDN